MRTGGGVGVSGSPTARVDALVDHLFRHQAGRLVATLTRIFGLSSIDLAEDVVQEALIQALRTWPYRGIPDRPEAWLMQVARNRALDRLRRRARWREREEEIRGSLRALGSGTMWGAGPGSIPLEMADDELRMIFTCCHPALPRDGQVALTLKTVGGFSTEELARAFLVSRPTMAQRIVRAKRRLREVGAELEVPTADELPARLPPVLEVLYLMFNEGYAAGAGEELVRHDLCAEAVRLARLVCAREEMARPEAHALLALLLLQASRLPGRLDAAGELLLLAEQDRSLWDRGLASEGLRHLRASASGERLTRYHLEAEIAARHAVAESWAETDWPGIRAAYDALRRLHPTPAAEVARTVAIAEERGAAEGLRALESLDGEVALEGYAPGHAVRGELLARVGRHEQAAASFESALRLDVSEPVRRHLEGRLRTSRGETPAG